MDDPTTGELRTSAARRLATLLCVLSACVACTEIDDGQGDYDETNLGPGVVSDLVSDGRQAYLATSGLFSPTGKLRAIGADESVRWTLDVPSTITDLMVGLDGHVYVGSTFGTLAATADGEWTAFDGARGGQLAWHAWGLPMAAPPTGGLAVMDARGDVLLEGWSGWYVWDLAVDARGAIYAVASPRETLTADAHGLALTPHVLKLTERFELVWYVPLDVATHQLGHPRVALSGSLVVASWADATAAWTPAGEVAWSVTGAAGPLVVDEDDTTYISGSPMVAVDATGEILWQRPSAGHLTLTGDGLGGMVALIDDILGAQLHQARLDARTGEVSGEVTWTPMTDTTAPVLVGDRLVGAAHQITGSTWFPEGGGIVAEQGSESFINVTSVGGGTSRAPWPTASGPGSRRALPVAEVQPDEDDLFGLWVAREGSRARALHLTDEAWHFGLDGERVYGIFDYDVRQPPRLVQVGRWSYDGATLHLDAIEDLAGGRARADLQVYSAPPGQLAVDDPLQDLARTFRRARSLPGADTLVPGSDTLGWLFGEGALDGDLAVAITPDEDGGATVVSTFAYIARLGGGMYTAESTIDGQGNVISDASDQLVWSVRPDGTVSAVRHNRTPQPGQITELEPRADGVYAVGPFSLAERAEPVFAARVETSPDAGVSLADVIAWQGPPLEYTSPIVLGPASLYDGGALFAGTEYADDGSGTARTGLVMRVGDDGAVQWRTDLTPSGGGRAFGVTATTEGVVVAVGEMSGELELGESTLRAPGTEVSTYVARLDAASGEVLDGFRIAGRLDFGAVELAATPDGGFVLAAQPRTLYNAGSGGVRGADDRLPVVISAFDADAQPLWTRALEPDASGFGVELGTLAVDPFGNITIGGRFAGDYTFQGVPAGRDGRTTALLQLDPCGSLLWQRRFDTWVSVRDVAFDAEGHIWAAGGFLGDLWSAPWFAPFSGGYPDVGTGFAGGPDTLVFTVTGSGDRLGDERPACLGQARSGSLVRVRPDGLGRGRVVSEPAGIDCPGQCEATFPDLSEVVLRAEPGAGSRFEGFGGAGCAGPADCALLVAEDAEITAWFEASSLAWSQLAGPELFGSQWRLDASDDGAVLVASMFSSELSLGEQSWTTDEGVVVVRFDDSGQAEVHPVPGSAKGALVWGVDLGPDGAVAIGGGTGFVAASSTNAALMVVEADGQVRWSRELAANPMNSTTLPAFGDDLVAIAMATSTTVTIDDQTVDAPEAVVALFDAASGDLVTLLGLGSMPSSLWWDEDDGTLVLSGEWRGTTAEVYPGVAVDPSRSGPWFLRLDRDLGLVDFVHWRHDAQTLPPAFDGHGSTVLVGVTDRLLPAWLGYPGGPETWPHPLVRTGDGWVLGNVDPSATALPGQSTEEVILSAVRLDAAGRPRASWSTPAVDDFVFHALAARDSRVIGVAQTLGLRGDDGETAASFETRQWVVVGLELAEAPDVP